MSSITRSEKLALRLTPQAKQRLIAAAEAEQRSVNEFMLQSALERANETLADRWVFSLRREDRKKFQTALDAPQHDRPVLRILLNTSGLFENTEGGA